MAIALGVMVLAFGIVAYVVRGGGSPVDLNPRQTALHSVESDVNGLAEAERGYADVFGEFMACGTQEGARARAAAGRSAWDPNADDGCWTMLGWEPDEPDSSPGGFWVEVDGDSFTVHGLVDADGDGQFAEWVATKDAAAEQVSADGVI